ncbi:pre-mrna-splicing factor cwc25 [Moniliophthora roreri MCA 2997]|uniref:Pre-mrna-splicing factor cwc25 n=1 Tax=Moniliophthora roreri (strain MCA 2997) TaxID=1381753 RepID=V2XG49_MONRO|nr:pre-mrna-splicing factor cwc25 [Moniliophthora roreri MCA 2997]
MGGGDLNMKKSWHPLLLKNQERVWLEEKKALEEKKKLDQLRKEKEEERQLQELQRLQEEQTGKKRTEKLEWMYTTPATGSSQNPNDLEDYLLGKKRVDKILTGDENAKIGASHKNFIAVQNANSARDIAAKVREDPLFAIKQQEQAAYEALMSNPLRLREMQERNGIKPKKNKKEKKWEKEERKRVNYEKKYEKQREDDRHSRRRSRSRSEDRYRRRSPSPYSRRDSRRDDYQDDYRDDRRRYSRSPVRDRQRYRDSEESLEDEGYGSRRHSSDQRSRSTSPDRSYRRRSRSPRDDCREYHRQNQRARRSPPPAPRTHHQPASGTNTSHQNTEDRAARLAAMTSDAKSMDVERQERLRQLLEKEKAELAADEAVRAKSKGMGGFLGQEQKRVFGGSGGLEERIRRGRGGMVIDAD